MEPLASGELAWSLRDGRAARLRTRLRKASTGAVFDLDLAEEVRDSEFRTRLAFGTEGGAVACHCTLEAGHRTTRIAPITFDAHCPKLVREVLAMECGWHSGRTPVRTSVLRCIGADRGRELGQMICDPGRDLPLVVISEASGFLVHPNLDHFMARETLGHATSVLVDTDAAWEVTNSIGRQWSCFNGAIRVFWPGAAPEADPFAHPLWTATKLMERTSSTEVAAQRIVRQVRRILTSVSTFSVRRPRLIDRVIAQAERDALDVERAAASDTSDFVALAETYAESNDNLRKENDNLQEEISHLQDVVANYKTMSKYAESVSEDVAPDESTPPQSITEAVETARAEHAEQLLFGDDVEDGLGNLAQDAGPPEKILAWLGVLAEASMKLQRDRSLGTALTDWLTKRGLTVSTEGQVIKSSKREKAKRTWHDGQRRRVFLDHMKPTDATAPDRCVRIYYEWCSERKIMIVGWVGRHP
jgi:hypothetical protein